MKADLYVQGQYQATIDLPAHSPIALVAKVMTAFSEDVAKLLKPHPANIAGISCTISLRYNKKALYSNKTAPPLLHKEVPWPDTERPNGSSTRPAKPSSPTIP